MIPTTEGSVGAAAGQSGSPRQVRLSPDGLVAGTHALFTFPNRVLFGVGTRASLAAELNRLLITRPLIVTDAGLVAAGVVAEVAASIAPVVVFQGVQANPTETDVLTGLEQYNTHRCDGLIGLGGGSSVDAAKAIRLLVTHPGRLADYDYTQGGLDRITSDLPPLVAEFRLSELATRVGLGRRRRRTPDHPDRARACPAASSPPSWCPRRVAPRQDRRIRSPRDARPCHRTNPRPCTQTDMENLLERAW